MDEVYLNVGNGKFTSNGVINIVEKEEEKPLIQDLSLDLFD